MLKYPFRILIQEAIAHFFFLFGLKYIATSKEFHDKRQLKPKEKKSIFQKGTMRQVNIPQMLILQHRFLFPSTQDISHLRGH
jgi:hypothetical protein